MSDGVKRYSTLISFGTFEERLKYLSLGAKPFDMTFGGKRWANQRFYHSYEWRRVRSEAIVRDQGLDLAFPGMEIRDRIYIHHLNPITIDDIAQGLDRLLDLDNLVCVSMDTHNAIHYVGRPKPQVVLDRKPGDTTPWKGSLNNADDYS